MLNNNFTSQILGREFVEKLLQSVQLLDCSLPRPPSRRYTRMVSQSLSYILLNIGTKTRTLAASFSRCQLLIQTKFYHLQYHFFTKIQLAVTAIDIIAFILILTSVSCAQFRLKNSYNSSLVPFFNLIFIILYSW